MTRRTFTLVATVLVLIGAAIRIHNGLSFPVLASYDGFAHFTYVWYLSATRHIPLPTSGWEFFHPPFYYALMAGLWTALSGIDPVMRLHIGVAIIAAAGLLHVAVVWDVVRRRAPEDRLLQLLAVVFMLFLPVHLYSAGFLGNEGLTAVLCSLAFLVLLAHLRRPTWPRSLVLGLVLGLAMLTKITALAVVIGALVTIALKGPQQRRWREMGVHLAVVLATLLATCGWYYARNVEHYGTPFVMSRRELMLRLVEDSQPQARRSAAEYLLFDPMIFRRPMWPRGTAGSDDAAGWSRALRDSVWTGLYANTWFDGFGGWTVPRITESELSRRAGQALLVLGVVPTLVVLLGLGSALVALCRRGWDDVFVSTLLTIAPMLAIFVLGTRAVPIAAAVKATYLLPVTAAFGVGFALGLERLRRWRPSSLSVVAVVLMLLSTISVAVFWHGLLFDERARQGSFPMIVASEANQYGVVYYAGGDRRTARQHFERAAADGLYLGYENLALLAFEDGRPDEALHLLKRAVRLQPTQSFGNAADRALYDRGTRAEYLNLVAVFEHARDGRERAGRAAATALRFDPTLPEAHYDLAVTMLEDAAALPATSTRMPVLVRAQQHLDRAIDLDPGFAEARSLRVMAPTLEPGCVALAAAPLDWERSAPGDRLYPVETGPGAPHAAAIGRRRHIGLPDRLRAASCGG
jgi:tetratricopeptide (TPR) repeat protein